MTQKPKRKLKNIDFSDDTSHIALVSKNQGGPASGANYSLVLKNVDNPSPEFIQKMQQIQVTYELPDFLRKVMGMYYEDAEVLARMMGYVEPEKEEDDYDDWYENYIEEKLQSFTIIKSLHEAKNLPEALSKLTEQDYLDVLQDQMLIEKALKTELDKEEKPSKADTSTNVENTKVEASASKVTKNKKEKQMATPEMVEKSELIALQKSLDDQRVALEKALADVKRYEDEKKEAIVKSKTDAVKAVVKDEKQAAVVVKAALALEDQADFDALVEVFKSMNALIEKSGLFQEQGVSAEAAEDKPGETKLMKALKARHQAKQ
jgi:hypothetical protein